MSDAWLTDNTRFTRKRGGGRLRKTAGNTSGHLQFHGKMDDLQSSMPVVGEKWTWRGVKLFVLDVEIEENDRYPDVGLGTVTLAEEATVRHERFYLGQQLGMADLPKFAVLTKGEREYCIRAANGSLGEGTVTLLVQPSALQNQLITLLGADYQGRPGSIPGQRRTTIVSAEDVEFVQDARFVLQNPPKKVRVAEGSYFVRAPVVITVEAGRTTRTEEWFCYEEHQVPKDFWTDNRATKVLGG
jgi:hypothetical protein